MQWVLIQRVGHLAFYYLTKISGFNRSNTDKQEVKHFSTAKIVDVNVDSQPTSIGGWNPYGWTEDANATTPSISLGGTVTMSGDKTIYAIYRRDSNFYSGVNKASVVKPTQYYNTTNKYFLQALPLSQVTSIDGFTSKGWVTNGGADVAFNEEYTGSANVFYAKYERKATFYHGINKAASVEATQTYTSDNVYKVSTPATSKATDIGNSWTATKWFQPTASELVNANATYTGSYNVFYAYYERTITINYDANGGTGETPPTTITQTYNSNDSISPRGLPLGENSFKRTGYNFAYWDLGDIGETEPFAVGDAATKTAKAQWSGYTYTVKYAQGTASSGYSASTYPDQSATYPTEITLHTNAMTKNDTEKSGSKITISFNANSGSVSPTSATSYVPIGYSKNGWTKTSGSQIRDYADGAKYTDTVTDKSVITLYPCFTQSDKTRTGITMPTPTKNNYSCTGWWSATSGGTKLWSCGVTYNNITTSRTAYAQWTNADKKITFSNVALSNAVNAKKPDGAIQTHKKTVYTVTFELKAAMTWQQMIDSDTYKWPTAFSGTIAVAAISGTAFPSYESFKYTSRSAVQSGSDDCYLTSATRSDLDGTVVFFPGYCALNKTSNYAAYNYYYQIICDDTTTQTSSSSRPANPTLVGDTINVGSTYYMTSGSDTDPLKRSSGSFVFRTGT